MTTETSPHNPRAARTIKLRMDRYNKVAHAYGWTTNAAAARDLGLSETLISRILAGKADPNLQFVLALLDVAEEAGFRRMFEIVTTNGSEEVTTQ